MNDENKIPSLFTIKQFCEKHKAFKEAGIRHQVFYKETNGMKKSGAIVRNGRRVLIDEEKFFQWIKNNQE